MTKIVVAAAAVKDEAAAKLPTSSLDLYIRLVDCTEGLRITPNLLHSDADIDHLVHSLATIWADIGIKQAA